MKHQVDINNIVLKTNVDSIVIVVEILRNARLSRDNTRGVEFLYLKVRVIRYILSKK